MTGGNEDEDCEDEDCQNSGKWQLGTRGTRTRRAQGRAVDKNGRTRTGRDEAMAMAITQNTFNK